MRYSPFTDRIAGQGVAAWDIHHAAVVAAREGQDVIVLSIGDPDFATPQAITEAAVQALHAGDTHYAQIPGRPALRQALAARYCQLWQRPLTAANVCTAVGAQNALFAVSMCLLQPGDEVIVLEPMYVTYEATIQASGATLVRVACPADRGFRLDLPAVAAAITPRTRAVFLANPNNPTGVVLDANEVQALAQLAITHNLWVIEDQVYESLTYDVPHLSLAALPGMAERCVVVSSLSKSHAMTGWRVGWVIAEPGLISHIETLMLCMTYGLPGFLQTAALAALASQDEITAQMRAVYRQRRDLVVASLSDCPQLVVLEPDAGMFVLVDVRGTGLSSLDFAWRLLRETGVAVLDAEAFGASAAGFVRISFTLGNDRLAEACRRIHGFVDALQAP
jgi:arginine:pyruvate transaminase